MNAARIVFFDPPQDGALFWSFVISNAATVVVLLALFTAPEWVPILYRKVRFWRQGKRATEAWRGVAASMLETERLILGPGIPIRLDDPIRIRVVGKTHEAFPSLQLRTDLVNVEPRTAAGDDWLARTLGRDFDRKTGGPLAGLESFSTIDRIQAKWDREWHEKFMASPFRKRTDGRCGRPACPICCDFMGPRKMAD